MNRRRPSPRGDLPAVRPGLPATVPAEAHDPVVRFLQARLVEELALLWDRDLARPDGWAGPGLAAQVEAVDGVLRLLDSGRLPSRVETHLLLHAYRTHPDHDPAWTTSA